MCQARSCVSRLAATVKRETTGKRAYRDAVRAREQLKAQLQRTPLFLIIDSQPQVVLTNQTASPEQRRLDRMQESLDGLRMRYTDNHPDVISTIRAIEDLRNSMAQKSGDAGDGDDPAQTAHKSEIPNALYQQLELRLSEMEPKFVVLRRNMSDAETEVRRLEQPRLTAPEIETQLQDLERDYGIIKSKYNEFLARREAARISQAAEATTDTIQFRIVSPPQVPVRPSAPKRELLIAAVLAVALGGGAGFAFLLGQIDGTMGAGRSLTESFGVPIIGTVSLISSSGDKFRRTLSNTSFGITLGTLIALCATMILLAPELKNLAAILKKQQLPSQLSWVMEILTKVKDMSF